MVEKPKLKIVISLLFYMNLTGSELYAYDLAHELLKRGHTVTIHAPEIGGILFNHSDEELKYSPRPKVREKPDIILAQHHAFSEELINNTPDVPVIYTIHSEKLPDENPIKHPNIRKYITVRQSIADHIISHFDIDPKLIEIIPNGIDLNRFKPSDEPKVFGLIPANISGLRAPFIQRLYADYASEKMLFVGMGTELLPDKPNVEREFSVWDTPSLYAKAKWAAGLFLGRTMYEAWACNVPFKSFYWDGSEYPVEKPENFEEIYSLTNIVNKLESIYLDEISK